MKQIVDVDDSFSFIETVNVPEMNKSELINLLNNYKVIKQGHFELLSSLHSKNFIQFNLFGRTSLFSLLVAKGFVSDNVDIIFTRDTSAVRLATGVSEELNKDIVIAPVDEKSHPIEESEDYEDLAGKRVLIVEDIITTANGIKRLKRICELHKAEVVGVGAFMNRGYKTIDDLRAESAISKLVVICTGRFEHYENDKCPICDREGRADLVEAKDLNKAITFADIKKRIKEKERRIQIPCHV